MAVLCALLLSHPASAAPVRLPVEVMGPNNVAKYLIISVPSGPAVASLWMQAHGLTYADKASVRVGSGPWVPLSNTTAQVAEPGKSYGGIGGAFGTISLTVPLPQGPVASGGPLLVAFRFNHTDGVSIGFRVLKFNLLAADGTPLLPASTFLQDDPALWTPPLPGAANVAAGDALWHNAPLAQSGEPGAPPILATCADCHAHDGADLHYFNYSNYSIEERSKFHGLTITQGKQIASYIRSRPGPAPGRPWNPPFQPGPGLDSKPKAEWAAGAGLSAVLPTDAAMLPYLFPNGVNKAAAATTGTLNMRELPVAFQMLDWNRWLPTIHPKDGFGDDFNNSALPTIYRTLRARFSAPGGTAPATLGDLPWVFDDWWGNRNRFQGARETSTTTWTPEYARAMYSLSQWQVVKTWEIMQEFGLQDKGPAVYGAGGEKRTWFDFSVFSASPAMSGIPEMPGLLTPDTLGYEYLTSAWYYAGIVVNSGNHFRFAWRPVDWGYSNGRIFDLARQSHVPEMLRYTAMQIKAMQQNETKSYQWSPFWVGDLTRLTGWSSGNNGVPDETVGTSGLTGLPSQAGVIGAVAGAWLDKTRQFTPQWYYSTGQANAADALGPYDSLSMTYDGLQTMHAIGVDSSVVNGIADWGKTIWPTQNWAALKQ